MTARILLLGHDKDYYLAKTDHDSIALAVSNAFKTSSHMSHEDAVLEQIADCATVLPADQLHHYGASFTRSIAATAGETVIDRLSRLFDVLLAEADHHKADYVLVHSLSFAFSHSGGDAITVWAQLLNSKQGLSSPASPAPHA